MGLPLQKVGLLGVSLLRSLEISEPPGVSLQAVCKIWSFLVCPCSGVCKIRGLLVCLSKNLGPPGEFLLRGLQISGFPGVLLRSDFKFWSLPVCPC